MSWREFGQRLGIGKLALALYHRPVGTIRDSLRNGGPLAERETERQRIAMETAAATLPPLPEYAGTTPVTLHLMTGRRFWYQTAFCLHTFARQAQTTTRVEIYDDGTIDAECEARLGQLGGGVRIHGQSALRAKLDALLPEKTFPVLRDRWINYPNIRKLIDVHLGSAGWKLVIDSDLLFFRRPALLIEWLHHPDRLLHAIDCEESYGYSRPLLQRLAGAPLPNRLNVGLCGLQSDALDWEQLEAWTAELQQAEGTHYYLEQALVAMLTARRAAIVAPENDYVTRPTQSEVISPSAVMHHYVANSKRWYFRYGWRHAVTAAAPFTA